MMQKIKILSDNIINQIAAGEVIDRPSSVVKELLENAIDSSAKNISIYLEHAGKNLIIITDDGCGMNKEDLILSVRRHATSKLDENNIHQIDNLGFRGEALSSIGAASKLSIISRSKESTTGNKITVIGEKIINIEIVPSNIGTIIEVRDLFFSIPVRLKFLRSDRSELNNILLEVKKLALAFPEINFVLSNEKREILSFKNPKNYVETDQILKHRITELLGKDFIENSAHVLYQYQGIKISGYTSIATFNKSSSEDQFLFLNKRPIKDRLLSIALKIAYRDVLMRDRHPVAVLFIEMDQKFFDINVHPNKTEVRFFDPNHIKNSLIQAVKSALSQNNKTSTTIAKQAIEYMRSNSNIVSNDISNNKLGLGNKLDEMTDDSIHYSKEKMKLEEREKSSNNTKDINQLKQQQKFYPNSTRVNLEKQFITYKKNNLSEPKEPNHTQLLLTQPRFQEKFYSAIIPNAKTEYSTEHNKVENLHYPMGAAKTQISNSYIISQTEESLIIIDQHAVDERIGYEKIKAQIEKNGLDAHNLLIPEKVEFVESKHVDLLESYQDNLLSLALEIERKNEKEVEVIAIPAILSKNKINIRQLVIDIAYSLSDIGEDNILINLIEKIAKTYSCYYAIRAKKKLSIIEMNQLLRNMEKTNFSAQCNHGRPTYVKLHLKEIGKLFNRT